MIRRLRTRQEGFTLIEVLVAALIVVVAMTALATIFIGAQNEASAEVQQNQLINIADRQIEQIRASVDAQGFSALGVMLPSGETSANFTPLSGAAVRHTWLDPEKFVEGGCFEIAGNYDNVSTSGSAPYGSAPAGFTPWSNCNSQSEPLQSFTSGGLIQWTSGQISACATGASSTLVTPCWMKLSTNCTATGTYAVANVPACAVTVYSFVTDTYVGCVTSPNGAPAGICPTLSGSGVVQATQSCMTTSVQTSAPCADARRVTVAIVPASSQIDARVTPLYLSAVFTNPSPSMSQASPLGLTAGVTL